MTGTGQKLYQPWRTIPNVAIGGGKGYLKKKGERKKKKKGKTLIRRWDDKLVGRGEVGGKVQKSKVTGEGESIGVQNTQRKGNKSKGGGKGRELLPMHRGGGRGLADKKQGKYKGSTQVEKVGGKGWKKGTYLE